MASQTNIQVYKQKLIPLTIFWMANRLKQFHPIELVSIIRKILSYRTPRSLVGEPSTVGLAVTKLWGGGGAFGFYEHSCTPL